MRVSRMRRGLVRSVFEAFRTVLAVALLAGVRTPASAGEDAESQYRAALKAVAKKERVFWDEFGKRQADAGEVARKPWRDMAAAMNGHGTEVDLALDHSGFHALYEDYARIERERVVAATALCATLGEESLDRLWRDLLAACDGIDTAERDVEAINDPTGDTWAATDQGPGVRRHGLQIRLDGLIQALARLRSAPAFLATTGWTEASKGDRRRSITRRVAVLDLLAATKAKDGIPLADQAVSEEWSSVRIAALECALQLDPAPRPALLACLRDPVSPVRRALLDAVRVRAPGSPAWIPALVDRLPEAQGLERSKCVATLATLAGRNLGPAPEVWKAWCETQRAAIEAGTFRAEDAGSGSSTVVLPSTTSFFGVTPLSEGIIFALEGGYNLLVPADYDVQRTKAFLDWVLGKRQKDVLTHREVEIREFSKALDALNEGVGFAVLLCDGNGGVKVMGDRKLLRGGTPDVQKAKRFLETHAPSGDRSELANLKTAFSLAGLPVPGLDFRKSLADTVLFVHDGSLRGGPYLDPEAATLAVARWNRFRRVAIHTIRICNAGSDSELLCEMPSGWKPA